MNGKLCGAKLRGKDATCRKPPVAGRNRCRLHGGRTLQGVASATFTTGRHSKYLPQRLLPRFAETQTDQALVALRAELGLVDVRLGELLERLDTGISLAWLADLKAAVETLLGADDWTGQREAAGRVRSLIEQGASDYSRWAELGEQIDRRRKLVEAESRRLNEMGQKVTVQQAVSFAAAVMEAVIRHEPDLAIRQAIATDLAALGYRGDVGGDGAAAPARSLPAGGENGRGGRAS